MTFAKLITDGKISFTTDTKAQYERYFATKPDIVYLQAYKIVCLYQTSDVVSYKDITSILRLDKKIRYELFRWLSLFEDILNTKIYVKKKTSNEHIWQEINSPEWSLEDKIKYLFGENNQYDLIRKLRNEVMHNSFFIILDDSYVDGVEAILELQHFLETHLNAPPHNFFATIQTIYETELSDAVRQAFRALQRLFAK